MSSDAGDKMESEEKTVMSAHCSHCGGTCLLKCMLRMV